MLTAPLQLWDPVPHCQGPAAAPKHGWRREYSPMAGAAMPMRDTTTWKMAFWAAAVDSPRRFPFSSVTGIPTLSSLQGEVHGWGDQETGHGHSTGAHLHVGIPHPLPAQ